MRVNLLPLIKAPSKESTEIPGEKTLDISMEFESRESFSINTIPYTFHTFTSVIELQEFILQFLSSEWVIL